MLTLRTGIDLIEIKRVREAIARYGNRLLDRIYTTTELEQMMNNTASLAARFAAKEAVSKALGTGIGAIGWHDIEILHGTCGEPVLHLTGNARQAAQELGLTQWAISLSHTDTYALASVVACGMVDY